MKSNKKVIVGLVAAGIIAIGGAGFAIYQNNQVKTSVESSAQRRTESDELDIDTVVYNGQEYKRNKNIQTILFMGVDKQNQILTEQTPVYGGQSDCLMLFVLDKEKQTERVIQISRDSMVGVDIYDSDGNFVETKIAQLCLQYAYGDGKARSCKMTEDLVSSLFYNIPINGYAAMNVEGISIVTTAMGGVDITVPEDYTMIDPSFTQGAQVNLAGELAMRYVRYRNTEELGSNNGRMERQTQFLLAMAHQLKAKFGGGDDYSSLLDVAKPYMVSDLDGETINRIATYSLDENILKVPGQTVAGIDYDEYEVDIDALYPMILDVFYTPSETPATDVGSEEQTQ